MKTTIYKYSIHPDSLPSVKKVMMPDYCLIFKIGLDPLGTLSIWAGVNPAAVPKEFAFHVIGTGQEIPQGTYYMDTVTCMDTGIVYHIFAEKLVPLYRHQLIEMY